MENSLEDWQAELQKLRRQNNSNSLPAARKPAQLLASLESTLEEQSTLNTPTAHLLALVTLLQQLNVSTAQDAEELIAAALYLLAVEVPFVPQGVWTIKSHDLIQLAGDLLPSLLSNAEAAAPLRSLLTSLQYLYGNLPSNDAGLAKPEVAQLFNTLLPLLADARPKVRRKAHEFVWSFVFSEKLSRQHIYAGRVAEHTVRAVTGCAKDARGAAGKKDNNSHASAKHEEAISRLNSLCAFIKGAARKWPVGMLPSLLAAVLVLPRLQNQYLSRASYDILELLLDPTASSAASQETVSSALEALLALKPPPSAVVVLPGWLTALETVSVALARICPEEAAAIVDSHLEGCLGFCASSIESDEVRVHAEKAACALVRWCIPENGLEKPLQVVSSAMKDLRWKGKGLPHLLGVLAALVSRCRSLGKGEARTLLGPLIADVGHMRVRKHFEYRQQADQVIAAAVEVGEPKWLLGILPLNLISSDGRIESEGRAWLLPILRGHITNTELRHFVSELVPTCEALFNLRAAALTKGKAAEVEAKVYEALVEQIWALLPGYCDLPTDLPAAFTRHFAELLSNVLYSQPTLRPHILRGLQLLVEKNRSLSESTSSPELLQRSFGLNQATGKQNLSFLSTLAPSLLSVMFNVFAKAGRESGGYILECVTTYISILSAEDLASTYDKIVTLFNKALATSRYSGEHKTSTKGPDVEPPATHTMLDLLITLSTLADTKMTDSMLALARKQEVLFNADPTVQKKAYRLLGKLCDSNVSVIHGHLEDLIAQLSDDSSPKVAAAAKRYRTELLSRLLELLPPEKLHFIPSLLPEAVLATKEANTHTREAGFGLLIMMAQKMAAGGTVQRSLLQDPIQTMVDDAPANLQEFFIMVSAGLAGSSPHMISATITALARLLFDYHGDLTKDALDGLLGALTDFLGVATREVVRSALGFWKVAVVCLDVATLEPHLSDLVSGLLTWSSDHKNHFKLKVRHIFERLIRKFGVAVIEAEVPEDERKYINNIRKSQQRAKKKRTQARDERAITNQQADANDEAAQPRAHGQSAFDDALYGSESELASDEEESQHLASGRALKHHGRPRRAFLQEVDGQPMDLLDAEVTAQAPNLTRRPKQARFATNAEGKMIVGGPSSKSATTSIDASAEATAAYIEAIEGEDGHRRDSKGRVRFNKAGQKRGREVLDGDNDEVVERLEDLDVKAAGTRPRKRTRPAKEPIGAEFKAKRAGGDVSKNGVSPYAYVPLGTLTGRKGAQTKSKLSITGRKAGKGRGSQSARFGKK